MAVAPVRVWKDEPTESWRPPPSRGKILVSLGIVAVVVVAALVIGAVVLNPRSTKPQVDSSPPTSSTPATTQAPPTPPRPTSQWEVASPNPVDLAVYGHLAKGDCFGDLPVLDNALHTSTNVETIACPQPHKSQVIGFVTVKDVDRGASEPIKEGVYHDRCASLMTADGVPEGLLDFSSAYVASDEELDAGAESIMCIVSTNEITEKEWTGSALDGTATGF
ncbi:MAG: hypothetical protein FWF02_00305 [Micrococcales bacterium]|nr:hypothetical protein [Micrococcales bacterium]MCL2666141.1 hypothetical protein [Micrococcales bacterium]